MKFDQIIEYNTINIFLEKSYPKCDGETIPRPFPKKPKLSISLEQHSKVLLNLFYCMQVWNYRKILKVSSKPLAFSSRKAS